MIIIPCNPKIKCTCEFTQDVLLGVTSKRTSNLFNDFVSRLSTPKEEKLLNADDYSFGVYLNTQSTKKIAQVLGTAIEAGLTLAGDESNTLKNAKDSVLDLWQYEVLIFGKSTRFDVTKQSFQETVFGDLTPVYNIGSDLETILKAIKKFAAAKRNLERKYPRNAFGPTLYELNLLSKGSKKAEKESTKTVEKTEIVVGNAWIRIGNKFYDKNIADTVIYETKSSRFVVPGIFDEERWL